MSTPETLGRATQGLVLKVEELVIDSCEPRSLARFWAEVLGYEIYEEEYELASIEDPTGLGPAICFQRVPEAKQVKNRVHLDLNVGEADLEPVVARLLELGATKVDQSEHPDRSWVVLADPEGNEFCVVG
jgi:catechol-2,3-dioxygenase